MEDDEIGDGLKVVSLSSDGSLDTNDSFNSHHHHPLNHQDAIGGLAGNGASNAHGALHPVAMSSLSMPIAILSSQQQQQQQQQRRRRKLPEIPKNRKCEFKKYHK